MKIYIDIVSTHSRAEAAAHNPDNLLNAIEGFQHTAARRRLRSLISSKISACEFQHTAARRRLPSKEVKELQAANVSTHSRAEAAASAFYDRIHHDKQFQHTAARRRLPHCAYSL